ncbi:MAG: ABC transporter ATP-binding protein [Rhizobiales bacterium]|nr:ABC transporter ATP-binding protein [Hyphomicrobiales bacterium]
MLELQNVHAGYGRAEILSDVSFQVEAGEVVALLGRNGAGKSTTLKSIMQLVKPTRGTVQFDGRLISALRPFEVARAGLGYVPEDRRVFATLSVLENLNVARQPPRDGAPTWSVEELYELFPNLAERARAPANTLSGGEQQMLTVARTLMGNPRAILLDEPSEGLAPLIVEQMAEAISDLKRKGVTILLSEQNIHFAKIVADRAIVIETGRIRFVGPIDEVLADKEMRAAYLSV